MHNILIRLNSQISNKVECKGNTFNISVTAGLKKKKDKKRNDREEVVFGIKAKIRNTREE